MREALLVPVGSTGDVLPYLAIGRELKSRGVRVGVLANEYFAGPVERAGLTLLPFGSRDEYVEMLRAATQPREVFRASRKLAHDTTRRMYDAALARCTPHTTVLAHTLAFGARAAAEKRGLRAVTAHLAPAAIDRAPVTAGFFNSGRRPRWYRRAVRWMYDRVADAVWSRPVNELRRELGLPREVPSRAGRIDGALGLFPEWFAPAQPDWPQATVLTGFMLYDDPGAGELPELPEKPIVFTPGTGKLDERRFFLTAIEASRRLGRPALLLTRFREQLPEQLPSHVTHAPFLPLSALLPRAAAIVHHGGIGTCAAALAAGTPQLVMPTIFDQLDNAERLQKLGVGEALSRRQFKPAAVERALRRLLENSAESCRAAAERMRDKGAAARACDAIYSETAVVFAPLRTTATRSPLRGT